MRASHTAAVQKKKKISSGIILNKDMSFNLCLLVR